MGLFSYPKCPKCGSETEPTGYAEPYPQLRCRPCVRRNSEKASDEKRIAALEARIKSLENDERRHPYQRGRASITGMGLESRKVIETGRLVGVALARLVLPSSFALGGRHPQLSPIPRTATYEANPVHLLGAAQLRSETCPRSTVAG